MHEKTHASFDSEVTDVIYLVVRSSDQSAQARGTSLMGIIMNQKIYYPQMLIKAIYSCKL